MVKGMTLASSALSIAAIANALFLKNSRPDVSTALVWFSFVTGSTALISETIEVFEPHSPEWEPSIEPEALRAPVMAPRQLLKQCPLWTLED